MLTALIETTSAQTSQQTTSQPKHTTAVMSLPGAGLQHGTKCVFSLIYKAPNRDRGHRSSLYSGSSTVDHKNLNMKSDKKVQTEALSRDSAFCFL